MRQQNSTDSSSCSGSAKLVEFQQPASTWNSRGSRWALLVAASALAAPVVAAEGELLLAWRVANYLYVIQVTMAEVNSTNRGRVANTGLIVGEDEVIVIDSGPAGSAADLAPMQHYLQALEQHASATCNDGRSADEAIKPAELPEFSGWHGFPSRHGRNVQHVYFEIERDDLGTRREGHR